MMENIVNKLRGQAAMEYLMTYGWALLVIVIVIAILISLNLFSAPQGCNFDRAGFSCGSPVIDTNGMLFLPLTNGNPNNVKLVAVVCTAGSSSVAPTLPTTVPQSGHGYFADMAINRQSTYDVSTDATRQPQCTKVDGQTAFGPVSAGTEFSGKIWVFYKNEEDGSNYPIRTASANIATKVVQATGAAATPCSPNPCTGATPTCCPSGATYTCVATGTAC